MEEREKGRENNTKGFSFGVSYSLVRVISKNVYFFPLFEFYFMVGGICNIRATPLTNI